LRPNRGHDDSIQCPSRHFRVGGLSQEGRM